MYENNKTQGIAVITVPVSEWQGAMSTLKNLSDKVDKLYYDKAETDLMTPAEVCTVLKIGRCTFQRHAKTGIIPIIKHEKTKRVYVKRTDLEALLNSGKI